MNSVPIYHRHDRNLGSVSVISDLRAKLTFDNVEIVQRVSNIYAIIAIVHIVRTDDS